MLGPLNALAALLAFASQPAATAPEAVVPAPDMEQPAPVLEEDELAALAPVIRESEFEPQVWTEPAPTTPPPVIIEPAPNARPPVILVQETETPTTVTDTPRAEILTPEPEILITTPAEPVTDPAIVSPTERRAIIKAAGEALSSVTTARGRFKQIAPDFSVVSGDFSLRRPGRVRFAYDAPVPILIVADGTTVAIADSELETVDRVPLSATPLKLVLDDDIDFENEAEIVSVRRANGVVELVMRDRTGETDGTLALILDARDYDLISWRATDEAGGVTSVQLENIEKNVSISPSQFKLDDYEDADDDDRR